VQNRTQQTGVGASLSIITSQTSGVVQGSVIGPLLFILYINDIVSLFDDKICVFKSYADDVKLHTVMQTKVDYYSLQCKLNQLFEWSERWQLTISYNNCYNMYVGNTVENNVGLWILISRFTLTLIRLSHALLFVQT